jgi:hypothetical protein
MGVKTTRTNITNNKVGRLEIRIKRLQSIRDAAERQKIKLHWQNQ